MSIDQVFQDFSKLKALIIGDVMMDAYTWGDVDRISPEAPVPVVRVRKRDYRLGGAANVALNVQALGAEPLLCSVIGTDLDGDRFNELLKKRNISSIGIVTSEDRPTTVKTRVISGHQHVVRVDEETDQQLSVPQENELWERIASLLPGADVVIFEDYDKGVISKTLIEKVVALAKEHDIPTVVDPKKRNFLNYAGVTLFKPNLKELREGLKIDLVSPGRQELENGIQSLQKIMPIRGALITLSSQGVLISLEGESHLLSAHIREIADVSGAGDTVISIAALCLALGLSPFLIAALSNLGGGLVCEHIGVIPIDKEDLLKEARKQNWV